MERVEKTVFLSYRRTNSLGARAIYQNLTQHGFDVFFDFTGIASGDFESVILENLCACAHFVVLLTPSALERCGEPGDWLRREIETALDSRRNIVPVMLEGFDFSTPQIAHQLTGKLGAIKSYNGIRVPPEFFDEAMARLRERYLNVPLTAVLHPASPIAKQAATEQKTAAESDPTVQEDELTAQQWFERGFTAADLDAEIQCYDEAIRLKPDYADVFHNRGVARYDKSDFDGAVSDLNTAIRLKPNFAFAFNNRGRARAAKGDIRGAIRDYNEAIRLRPDFVDPFYNRGIVWVGKGNFEEAIRDYSNAIRLKPDFVFGFDNRGVARQHKGDLEGAIKDFSEAIRLKPDHANAFNNRGIARKLKGDSRGAEEDFKQVERLKAAARRQ